MYQVYLKTESYYNPQKLIGEFSELEDARKKVESELAKNSGIKYIIEETTGHVDSYGELLTNVVESN